jgi:hypothetical protein
MARMPGAPLSLPSPPHTALTSETLGFANSIREFAERSARSLTREDAGQYSAEGSASGSEMQDSWAPLALRNLTYFQGLERHWITLDFGLGVFVRLSKVGSRDRVCNH